MTYEESLQFFYNRGFVLFDDLAGDKQEIAKADVYSSECQAQSKHIAKAKAQFKANKNKAINDPYHVRRLMNNMPVSVKMKTFGDDYLVNFIRSNVIWFNKDGTKADIYGESK